MAKAAPWTKTDAQMCIRDSSWALMQLQLELGRFLNAVEIYHYGGIDQEALLLRYDILWSRTPIPVSYTHLVPMAVAPRFTSSSSSWQRLMDLISSRRVTVKAWNS